MTNEKTRCTEAAKITLPWGGEILNYCPVHANQIALLGQTIGSPIKAQLLKGECQCESMEPLTEEEKQLNADFNPIELMFKP